MQMSQDNRLMPVSGLDREIDRPLSDLTQNKPYGVSALEPNTFRDYLFVVLKRKWLIMSMVLVITSLVTIQAFRSPSFYGGQAQAGLFTSLRRIFAKPKKVNDSPAVSTGLGIVSESQVVGGALAPEELSQLEPYEDAIIGGEVVEAVTGTSLVKIKFIHSDPDLAQKIANTLADVFVNNNYERAHIGSTNAEVLLAKEIANLQAKIKHDQEVKFNYA